MDVESPEGARDVMDAPPDDVVKEPEAPSETDRPTGPKPPVSASYVNVPDEDHSEAILPFPPACDFLESGNDLL